MAKKGKRVRVGLVGIGFMGKTHWDCFQANKKAEVVAICDVDKRKLDGDWSAVTGNIEGESVPPVDLTGISTYTKIEELVADPDVDLVDITLPSHLHLHAVQKTLKANKHCLCEKPLALNLTDANRMIAAAKKSKGTLMVAQCIRFWPAYARAKKLVAAKKFGKIRTATFFRISPTPRWSPWLIDANLSGGAILDLHYSRHGLCPVPLWQAEGRQQRGNERQSKQGRRPCRDPIPLPEEQSRDVYFRRRLDRGAHPSL